MLVARERYPLTVSPAVARSGSAVPRDPTETDTVRFGFWLPLEVLASAGEAPEKARATRAARVRERMRVLVDVESDLMTTSSFIDQVSSSEASDGTRRLAESKI
jgi:hypothetical protein